ncbi:manganese-dependent inorganic pyrophosphatase [Salisediminibacterium halotolerans]|uniref:manganese-dependent inorganic pyrophosphatase n=1 Tax=Salisediminibacterium halotolerans TaxID=517425 RepID=UPI000F1303F6|nr:manganese-dependent inorganic pyrophosphatase [Salisediminibacterium halotolerans]RLJ73245.1 manganese-dependent inorganic pyrophosphatase [Actinophytocola xinjiangensis]RPE86667.1 manganese-dependent inorganic pyrophosphatase [Salisediminibacterium halotolerans]TWG34042.1 manganese-dependent inorganic pyrophosphatase [Salisediminibacterium halotolerans]GEL08301.1 manganese-dependent inorganic pyrophosphatase [Salisediminibacterium halotolerans]
MSQEKVLVFGHQSPDTDTICSALVYADLKQQQGENVEAVRLGDVGAETQFALDTFGVKAPRFVEKVAPEANEVILVDHNEKQQSAPDIDDVTVIEVIDHHRIANFETEGPLYYRAEPVGCTATILLKLFKEKDATISKATAGLMLSSIISDSLLFKSPTCTDEDIQAAKELAEIAETDAEQYGLEMLKAGADMSSKSVDELLMLDAKEFTMGDHTVKIAQVNVVDTADVLNRKSEVETAMNEAVKANNYGFFALAVTDILTNNSVLLITGEKAAAAEQAFNVTLDDHQALLEGVVSRKKQIVPPLTNVMSGE